MTLSPIALAAALVAGLTLAETASAISLTITPQGNTTFTQGQTGQTVTFDFVFGGIATPTDVLAFHDVFLAFNTSFLTYDSISFTNTIVSAANGGSTTFREILEGGTDGNYLSPPNGWTYDGTNFGPGSLRIYQSTDSNDPEVDLFSGGSIYAGQAPEFTAFSITFDVITAQLGTSAIVMIDDRSYTEFDGTNNFFDYKNADFASVYPDFNVQASITVNPASVPVPAPLALMGLGLAVMGLRRRRAPRA